VRPMPLDLSATETRIDEEEDKIRRFGLTDNR
jgi:hypothetical protein